MLGQSARAGRLFALGLVFVIPVFFSGCTRSPSRPLFDLIIASGRVLDGTGNPWCKADVAVSGGRLAAIGRLDHSRARLVIEAEGLAVAPGFIDIPTHCDRDILNLPLAENYIRQGVTTVIGGNCGTHRYPLREVFRQAEESGFGLLREGMAADDVVFDPASFRDAATYENPHRYNPGLVCVLVNGEVVFEKGRHTSKKPGRILYGPGKRRSGL